MSDKCEIYIFSDKLAMKGFANYVTSMISNESNTPVSVNDELTSGIYPALCRRAADLSEIQWSRHRAENDRRAAHP